MSQAIDVTGLFLDQGRAVARQIAQFSLLGARNETCLEQAVFRPGTAFICCALTTSTSKEPSHTLYTGFQSTSVDSMATCVHPAAWSQSSRASKSAVMVPKRRISRLALPIGSHDDQAGHDEGLVDIESTTARIEYFHEPVSSSDLSLDISRGKSPTGCLLSTKFPLRASVLGATCGGSSRHQQHLWAQVRNPTLNGRASVGSFPTLV